MGLSSRPKKLLWCRQQEQRPRLKLVCPIGTQENIEPVGKSFFGKGINLLKYIALFA